jgi:Ca-activated chloride channel family protein
VFEVNQIFRNSLGTIGVTEQTTNKIKMKSFFSNLFIGKTTEDNNKQPVITFSDKASTPLQLHSQETDVNITLPLAKITSVLTFINTNNNKTLEGELVFPLPEEATLTGYALDVNGQLVDAVPLEKEKAEEVFEQEVRAGKGAAVVQMSSQSNTFKTRVYPLHPNVTRTIKVVYTMPVDTRDNKSVITIPFGKPLENVKVKSNIHWYQNKYANDTVEVTAVSNNGTKSTLKKNTQKQDNYLTISVTESDINLATESLVISSTQKLLDNETFVEDNYFCSRMKINTPETKSKLNSDRIQILWDCSFSRHSSQSKDLQLLKQILNKITPKEVVCTPFSLFVSQKYQITLSNTSEIVTHFQDVPYDGATDLSSLETLIDPSVSYCIVFTDGIHTIGNETTPETVYTNPLYIISTATTSNSQLLSHIATKSGGRYLNAERISEQQVIDQIGKPVLYFLVADYESEQFGEVYPNEPTSIDQNGYFHLYGKVKGSGGEIAVSFKHGTKIIETRVVQIEPVITTSADETIKSDKVIPLLWVKQKMNSLSVFPQIFDQELKELAREWSIVTPNTSLIVLEELSQYIKHEIAPPVTLPSLRKEYMENMTKKQQETDDKTKQKIGKVLEWWKETVQWHNTDFKPQQVVLLTGKTDSNDKLRSILESIESVRATMNENIDCLQRSECMDMLVSEECVQEMSLSFSRVTPLMDEDAPTSDSKPTVSSAAASIHVQKWASDAQYMKAIQQEKQDPYREYLKQRQLNMQSPAFFLDVADYWLTELKQTQEGITILSNILELELDSAQLLRIVGYRLDQSKEYILAEMVFKQVKKMRPGEPQSYRDLALVKEKLGKLSEAVDLLNEVIKGEWDSRFEQIEITAAVELNHILLKDPTLQPCHEEFRHKMDMDLRISMAWDTNDTDIDLHVHEAAPLGEHAYFGHRKTKIGGLVSIDYTRGYGPEFYMLKKAPSGDYQVKVRYFANHQQSLTGGTTILCTFFTNYMRPDEKCEVVTIRLTENQSDFHVCTIKID